MDDARDPGPIFPSLSGSDPGDPTALPPGSAVSPSELSSQVRGETLSLAPGPALVEGEAAPEPAPSAQIESEDKAAKRGRSFQDRINQLTRRYHESEEQNGALLAQIAELTKQVGNLQQQMYRPQPVASQQADLGALGLGDGPAKPPVGVSAPEIASLVTQAISSYDAQRRQADSTRMQFAQAQELSFEQAAAEMPELRDGRTTARQIWNELFVRSPLRTLPDGPFQIALQVKGILADEARAKGTAPVAERKAQASITTPTAPATAADANRQALQREYNEVLKDVRAGRNDYDTYRKFRILGSALQKYNR